MKIAFKISFSVILIIFLLFTGKFIYADGFNGLYSVSGYLLYFVGPNGSIYRSYDGGGTLLNYSIGTVNYNSISGKDLNIFIGGDNGVLLTSTDLGESFNQTNIGTTENIRSIYFISPFSGWAACSNGKIFKTNNSGTSWIQQPVPVSYNLNSIKFTDSLSGAACGNNGVVLITANGGASWNISPVSTGKDLLNVDLKSNTMMVSGVDAVVLKSTNLGITWTTIDYNIVTKPDIGGLSMVSPNTYYTCGIGGFIRKSINAGSSFTYQESPVLTDLKYIYFRDSLNGWALSSNSNVVLRTANGGANWSAPIGTVQTLSWAMKIPLNYYTSSGNDFYQSTWNKKEIFVTKANRI